MIVKYIFGFIAGLNSIALLKECIVVGINRSSFFSGTSFKAVLFFFFSQVVLIILIPGPAQLHNLKPKHIQQKGTKPINPTGYSLNAINGPRPKPYKPNRRRLDQTRQGGWQLNTWKHLRHRIDTRHTPPQPGRLRL